MTSTTLQLTPVLFCLLQLASTSPIYFILKPRLNWHLANLFSASSLITVTLIICNMAQSKVNKELANRVSLTNIDLNESYAAWDKWKSNSPLHGEGENSLLPLQTINSDQSDEALAGVATMMSLLSLLRTTQLAQALARNQPEWNITSTANKIVS